MTTPKSVSPEQIVTEVINSFFGFNPEKSQDKPTAKTAPVVDNVAEFNRLLEKAEKAAVGSENEADILLAIADKHLRLVETAVAFQK